MKLFYREYGEGKPIIIAHGLFGMSDNWIPIAKQLSAKYKVYLLDLRNHGQSPHSDVHTYPAISKDLFEFTEEFKINKAILIGHSMGGKAVMQFANDYPEKVEQMIILDISPREYQFNDIEINKGLNHKMLLKIMMETKITKIKSRKEISEYFRKYFSDDFILQLIQKNITKNNQKQFVWKLNVETLYSSLSEIKRGIYISDIKGVLNILFVFGSNSPYFRPKDKIYFEEKLPNATIKLINEADHFLHITNKEELTEICFDFLK